MLYASLSKRSFENGKKSEKKRASLPSMIIRYLDSAEKILTLRCCEKKYPHQGSLTPVLFFLAP